MCYWLVKSRYIWFSVISSLQCCRLGDAHVSCADGSPIELVTSQSGRKDKAIVVCNDSPTIDPSHIGEHGQSTSHVENRVHVLNPAFEKTVESRSTVGSGQCPQHVQSLDVSEECALLTPPAAAEPSPFRPGSTVQSDQLAGNNWCVALLCRLVRLSYFYNALCQVFVFSKP